MATIPAIGTQFVPASQELVRDQILADYRLEMLRNGVANPAVAPRSDAHAWATAHAGALMLLYAAVALARDGVTPLNATGEDLELWRKALGVPEVIAGGSTGKVRVTIPVGTANITDGEAITLPNGRRAEVVGNFNSISDGAEVDIAAIDAGEDTNFPADTEVVFPNPPSGVNAKATVSRNSPLTGGTDSESEERKRARVLLAVATKPGGGNWGQHISTALEALASLQGCAVYPAIGGPGSVKVVPFMSFDEKNSNFSREPNSAAVTIVRGAIHDEMPDEIEIVVEAPADEPVDAALMVEIPSSTLSGGNGTGWIDADNGVWPSLHVDDGGYVFAQLISSGSITIEVTANTTTPPAAGLTHIAWWSPDDMQFRTYLVTAVVDDTPGAYQITLDRPLVSSNGVAVADGDFICPAAVKSADYGKSWVEAMRRVGPGQNTDSSSRLPRAARRPFPEDEWPVGLTFQTLLNFRAKHTEMSDISWSYRSLTEPTVPADVADPPNILVPRHFAIYPNEVES